MVRTSYTSLIELDVSRTAIRAPASLTARAPLPPLGRGPYRINCCILAGQRAPSSWSGECLWGPSLGNHSGTCAWWRRKGVDLKVPGDVTFERFSCLAMSGWAAGSLQVTKGARRGGLVSCVWKSRGTFGLYREQRVSWWSGEGFCIINVFSLFFLRI